jgi:hypothetical protein
MNRSTWSAVLVTAVVLAGAGIASRMSWQDVFALARRGGSLLEALRAAWLSLAFPARAAAGAGVGLGCAAALLVAGHRRRPRRLAVRLLRRGGGTARIARRTRMAQDALRLLLRSEGA